MPYIKQEDREKFKGIIENINSVDIKGPGELNYLLTMLVHKFLNQEPECYRAYNDALGALTGCKLKIYRRHISGYEDEKQKENGDV
jgi:hypothetical protein